MYRGTTPTNIISVDTDLTGMTIFVTYVQNGRTLFEKSNDSITIEADKLLVPLTQQETLGLTANKQGFPVYVQIRAIDALGNAIASNIMTTTAEGILKDGVISHA